MDVYKDWLGIPDGERPPDHYTLLRLGKFEDNVTKIQSNYKKLNAHVKKFATGEHADASQELLNELARAMLCLTDPERKRDYDESLGRDFGDDMVPKRTSMLNVLFRQKQITKEQAAEVQAFAKERGISMRDAVVQMKITDAETATQAYSQELGLPFVDLTEMIPDDQVLDRLPRNVVRRNQILPLFIDDDQLLVASADEMSPELEEELRMRYEVPIRRVLATTRSINQGIAQYYAPGMREDGVEPSGSAGKSKSGKKKAAAPKGPLTEEDKKQRKLLGIIMMCWGIIGAVAVDQLVLPGIVGIENMPMGLLSTYLVAPAVIAFVTLVYWKKQ